MGHRANYILIEQGQPEIYYSHWGAIAIPQEIFYGPDITRSYIQSLEPIDTLLDEVWCEGAVLMDLDQHQLLFWGGSEIQYSPALRRYFIPLLANNWEGWNIQWADQGIVDLAAYLNLDISQVILPLNEELWQVSDVDFWEESEDFRETILTVKYGDLAICDYAFDLSLTQVLSLGEELFDLLPLQMPLIYLPAEGSQAEFRSGAYLNLSRQEMWLWWATPHDQRPVERITGIWKNWMVKRHFYSLPFQIHLSGRNAALLEMKKEVAVKQILELLTRKNDFDPVEAIQSLVNTCAQEGQPLWINPYALQNHKLEINAERQERMLLKLVESLMVV